MYVKPRYWIVLTLFGALGAALVSNRTAAPAQSANDDPVRVTTYSGSGVAGFANGSANSAQFLGPMGLASDADGNVYVADAAAQRIRVVAPDGSVTTLAGSGDALWTGLQVAGGYRDGPADQARFNNPLGIAVTSDGATVYVADSLNHCIRKIHGGAVSTLAGRPSKIARTDGPNAQATFSYPRGLALARDGTLFVSDLIDGVREIAKGAVTTLPLAPRSGRRYAGMALWEQPTGQRTLFVGTIDSPRPDVEPFITAPTLAGGLLTLDGNGTTLYDTTRDGVEGDYSVGYPNDVVAVGPVAAAFTDIRRDAVRFSSGGFSTWIASHPFDDADMRGSGYRDGAGPEAQFSAPSGITRLSDGSLIVADLGNRVLRRVTGLDDRREIDNDLMLAPLSEAHDCYRVVVISNSQSFYDTIWHESAEGKLEDQLNTDRPGNGLAKPACVFAVRLLGSTVDSTKSFVNELLAPGLADAVVFELNYAMISSASHPREMWLSIADDGKWHARTVATLRSMKESLAQYRAALLVVASPFGEEFADADGAWSRLVSLDQSFATPDAYVQDAKELDSILQEAQVDSATAFPAFLALERGPHPPALFGTRDMHESPAGNAVLGKVIGDALERLTPWKHR